MQDNLDFYLESKSLFSRVREYLIGPSEEKTEKDSFQLGNLTFHQELNGHSIHQAGDDRSGGIFMDDAYEALVGKKSRFDLILWMNRDNSLAPDPMPEQDFDLTAYEQLMKLGSQAPRPTVAQCLEWWDEWKLPENVQRHVTQVAGAAYKLSVRMRQAGIDVDPILTHRAGLLHDLDKIDTLHKAGRHGHVSAAFLAERGYPQLADIVRNHLLDMFLARDVPTLPWEMKLVNYVDKLVEGDRIVLLPTRLFALKQRYPQSKPIIEASETGIWQLNDEICSILSLNGHEALVSLLLD